MKWKRSHLLIAGLAIIAGTNAVALLGVAWNRSGEPESRLTLTQRELVSPYLAREGEDSGLALRLHWRVVSKGLTGYDIRYQSSGGSPEWLDKAKMESLGFDTTLDTRYTGNRSFGRYLARDVLLVLELDGPAYRQMLELAKAEAERMRKQASAEGKRMAEELVPRETNENSRLFVVDAGLEVGALRARYPDRSKYAIVAGRITPVSRVESTETFRRGLVSGVAVDSIHVPLELRSVFERAAPPAGARAPSGGPRYEAVVAFGQRLEPWLVGGTLK